VLPSFLGKARRPESVNRVVLREERAQLFIRPWQQESSQFLIHVWIGAARSRRL